MRHSVSPGLEAVKQAKINELTAACDAAIAAGYESDALGDTHVYPSAITDQLNMMASIDAIDTNNPQWTTPFACVEPEHRGNLIWPWKDHDAAQIYQAGLDGKVHITTTRAHLKTLIAQVVAATTDADVLAIKWDNP